MQRIHNGFLAVPIILVLILVACGGGDGGGGGGSGGGNSGTNSYTLGGTITGLSGTGLVLANGSQTVSPSAGATSFTFPDALLSGTAYNVTVSASPAGLNCSVANGTGTITADVTNVTVTCSSSSHSVSFSWNPNHETGVNSAGGGYQVLVNGAVAKTVPYVSGSLAPTTTTITLTTGTYSVAVRAYAELDSLGGGSGTYSAASQPVTVTVP